MPRNQDQVRQKEEGVQEKHSQELFRIRSELEASDEKLRLEKIEHARQMDGCKSGHIFTKWNVSWGELRHEQDRQDQMHQLRAEYAIEVHRLREQLGTGYIR